MSTWISETHERGRDCPPAEGRDCRSVRTLHSGLWATPDVVVVVLLVWGTDWDCSSDELARPSLENADKG